MLVYGGLNGGEGASRRNRLPQLSPGSGEVARKKVRDREDAITNTRDACAIQSFALLGRARVVGPGYNQSAAFGRRDSDP